MVLSFLMIILLAISCRTRSFNFICCSTDIDVIFIIHSHRNGFSFRRAAAVISGGRTIHGNFFSHSLYLSRYISASSDVGSSKEEVSSPTVGGEVCTWLPPVLLEP